MTGDAAPAPPVGGDGGTATASAGTGTRGGGAPGTGAGDAVGPALAYILRSTGQRPQTVAEVAAKLERRGVAADVAAVALRRAETLGALDDAAFARAWVSDRGLRRGFATPRLRHELRRRLVPAPVVEAALAALDDRDDRDAATALARARAATLPASLAPPVVARRLEGFLVRRGYPPGVARPVAIAVSGMEAYRAWD